LPAPAVAAARPQATPGDNVSARTLLATATHLASGVITLAFTDFLDAYPDVTVQVAMMGGAISYVTEQVQMAAEEGGTPLAAARRRDVVREFAGLVDRLGHDAEQILAVGGRWQPLELPPLEFLFRERHAVRIEMEAGVHADAAVELAIGQAQAIRHAVLLED